MELKKYLQDRPILFLNITIVLLAIYNVLSSIIKIDNSRATAIVAYLPSLGIIDGPQNGSPLQLYTFALASLIISLGGMFFAARMHSFKRDYSLLVLLITVVLLVFNIIVSESILSINNSR